MKHKRKRAAGGGRKPNDVSGPGTPFTVRLPADVLDSLRAAADKGETMSGALVRRLRFAVAREGEAERNPAVQAICDMIVDVGQIACGTEPETWHLDPTLFRLFKIAVIELLDGIAPEGPVEWPKDHARSMEDIAQVFAQNVLLNLRRAAPPQHEPDIEKRLAKAGYSMPITDDLADTLRWMDAQARRRFYDMQRVGRALGFENGKRKNEGGKE